MKKLALVLSLIVVLCAPWKLMAVVAESFCLTPGETRFSDADDQYWQTHELEGRLLGMGWAIGYTPDLSYDGQRANGLTDREAHTVQIETSLHWNARRAVLAHEGGHILQPWWVEGGQAEAFAEMVATLVADDELREHARYLARDHVATLVTLLMEWPAVYHAAAVLEDR